jgi:hypothetical protein
MACGTAIFTVKGDALGRNEERAMLAIETVDARPSTKERVNSTEFRLEDPAEAAALAHEFVKRCVEFKFTTQR